MIKLLNVVILIGTIWAKIPSIAPTPPMGWLVWERFRCNVDCVKDPHNCISENLFKQIANHLVEDGYAAAGYKYVNIDDCWMNNERSADGKLYANSTRFPNGIKHLADYMHERGLKLGIYQDYGTATCAGYPGLLPNHIETDIQTYAEWGIDMLKVDGCHANISTMATGYPKIGSIIDKVGRNIVYSCSWPDYEREAKMTVNYTHVAEVCHLWRMYNDIEDSWKSVSDIIDFMANSQNILAPVAGKDSFNDPDMLIIGNFGLNYEQSKTQMAIWSILTSPLLMSNDLRQIKPEMRDILLNREVIAVNQDPLVKQGLRISSKNGLEVWTKQLIDGMAVVLFNHKGAQSSKMSITFRDIGWSSNSAKVRDLFLKKDLGTLSFFTANVPLHGVIMLKLTKP
jgi:alpha-N-acetylgalactosaminidase